MALVFDTSGPIAQVKTLLQTSDLNLYSWPLFLTSIPDLCSWPLFLTSVPDLYSWPLFITSVPDLCSGPFFLTSVPDPCSWPLFLTFVPDGQLRLRTSPSHAAACLVCRLAASSAKGSSRTSTAHTMEGVTRFIAKDYHTFYCSRKIHMDPVASHDHCDSTRESKPSCRRTAVGPSPYHCGN